MNKKTSETRIKIILPVFILGFILTSDAFAGVGAASYLNIPVGARAAAMGGASVAIVNDAGAVYWNPARLGVCKRLTLTSSVLSNKRGDNGIYGDIKCDHHFLSIAVPLGSLGTIGLGFKNFTIGDIEIRNEDGEQEGFFSNNEYALFLAYGLQVVPDRMSIGLSYKYLRQKFTLTGDPTAWGQGISIGLSYQAMQYIRLALRADDDILMKWENGHEDQVLFKGVAGCALTLFQNHLIMTFDLEQMTDRPLKAHYGSEFSYVPGFLRGAGQIEVSGLAVRAGLDDMFLEDLETGVEFQKQTNITYGFGIGILIDNVTLDINYSRGDFRIWNQNRFTLSIIF